MKGQRNLDVLLLVLTFAICASFAPTFAQSTSKKQYEISEYGNKIAVVVASFDGEVVSASIYRQGQPAHVYRAYPQVAAIKVQIGDQKLFTYYIETGLIEARGLTFNIREVKWSARRQRSEITALRQLFVEDMRILRAVRGCDGEAHVKLAELAYVNLTGDNSIYEGQPSNSLLVAEMVQATSRSKTGGVQLILTAAKPQSTTGNPDSLRGCLDTCNQQKDACINAKVDPGKCYDNQTSCTNNCYQVYGNKSGGGSDKQPIQP